MEQMTQSPSTLGGVERWALLIGIDYYFDGTLRPVKVRPLKGCVRDVERVRSYLEAIKVPDGNIKIFTASEGADGGIKEPKYAWPTRNNIVKALDCILEHARPGALVYIHYSGHGILRKKIEELQGEEDQAAEGGNSFNGAALVPTDVKRGGAYLSAYQLGAKIKTMVERKQLRVTLVLDCCHSGQGLRDDSDDEDDEEVRGIEEEDETMLESDKDADMEADLEMDGDRNLEAAGWSWLEKPKSCTVLTACDVEEKAKEDSFTKVRHLKNGVLTHWVMTILDRFPKDKPPSHSTIRDHVASQIATRLPRRKQTPGIFGDTFYEFFGEKPLHCKVSSRVFQRQGAEGEYVLEVGSAQGVAVGATYELQGWEDDAGGARGDENPDTDDRFLLRPVLLRIFEVFDLRSNARPVLQEDAASIRRMVRSGHRAVQHEWALPRKTIVRVVAASSTELEESWLADFRTNLNTELLVKHNLVLDSPVHKEPEDFRLAVDKQHTVEIQDGEGMSLPWLPTISLRRSGARQELVRLLWHVARFQAIKELRYGGPGPANLLARNRFRLMPSGDGGALLGTTPGGDFVAHRDQDVRVEFTINSGSEPVWIVIFHLTDQFGVIRRWPPKGQPPYELYLSDLDHPRVLGKMIIPAERMGHTAEVKDTFRAYVYSGFCRPSWDELELGEVTVEPSENDGGDSVDDDSSDNGRGFAEKGFPEDGRWAVVDCTIATSESA